MARALSLLLILLGGLVSCAPQAELSLQAFGDPAELAALRAVASAYGEEHPGVEVRVVGVPDQGDHYAKLATAFAAGTAPDLFLMNYRRFPQFASRGVLDPPRDVRTADYFAEVVDAFQWDGRLGCLPVNASSLVVYYNRDAFEEAAVPLPAPGWSASDFIAAATQLTRPGRHGVAVEPSLIRLAPFVWSAGGELTGETGFTLDSPAGRRALGFFLGLGHSNVVPTEEELESEDAESRFAGGRVAMLLQSRRVVPTFREIEGFVWDVAPLPVLDQPASILHSDAMCVAAGGSHLDEARQFAAFAAGPAGQRILASSGRIVPSLRSVALSPAFREPGKLPESAHVFLDAIPTLRRTPPLPNWAEIERAADTVLEEAFFEPVIVAQEERGRDEITPVLRQLDERTRALFSEQH